MILARNENVRQIARMRQIQKHEIQSIFEAFEEIINNENAPNANENENNADNDNNNDEDDDEDEVEDDDDDDDDEYD